LTLTKSLTQGSAILCKIVKDTYVNVLLGISFVFNKLRKNYWRFKKKYTIYSKIQRTPYSIYIWIWIFRKCEKFEILLKNRVCLAVIWNFS